MYSPNSLIGVDVPATVAGVAFLLNQESISIFIGVRGDPHGLPATRGNSLNSHKAPIPPHPTPWGYKGIYNGFL